MGQDTYSLVKFQKRSLIKAVRPIMWGLTCLGGPPAILVHELGSRDDFILFF